MADYEDGMLLIEGISPDIERELGDAIDEFESGGIQCSFHYRAPQPQASLDWIVPTAVGIWFLDKYFGTMLSEAAKDHYKALVPALRKLYDKTLGAQKSVTRTVRQMDGTVRRDKVFFGQPVIRVQSDGGMARQASISPGCGGRRLRAVLRRVRCFASPGPRNATSIAAACRG